MKTLIAKVFATRDLAHLRHWSTDSYAEHMALGDFYEEIISKIDEIIESYQSNFGRVGEVKLESAKGDILKHLRDEARWLDDNRETISQGIPAIQNLLDELTGIYLRTIYKLQFLK